MRSRFAFPGQEFVGNVRRKECKLRSNGIKGQSIIVEGYVPLGNRALHEKYRMETLSDGVIAIALTLLILNVIARADLVDPKRSLASHLFHLWPTMGAYVLGFMSIIVCWVNHHRLFHYVTKIDSGLLLVNSVQLLLISAVPLPTALLAANLTKPGQRTALIIYGVDALLVSVMFLILWCYVVQRGLTDPTIDPSRYRGVGPLYVVGIVWTSLAVVAACFSLYTAFIMWAIMFGVWAFPAEMSRVLQSRFVHGAVSGRNH